MLGDRDAASPTSSSGVRKLEGTRKINLSKFEFEGWSITVLRSPILPSNCYCDNLDDNNSKGLSLECGRKFDISQRRDDNGSDEDSDHSLAKTPMKCQVCRYSTEIQLKHYPEMVFPDNILHLEYQQSGFVIQFNTLDAMKMMTTTDTDSVRVQMAEAWQASKNEMGLPKEILHDFNWTFTTEYQGSIRMTGETNADDSLRIEKDTTDKINMEKLMQREQILFFEELTLFEDELHDNGISNLSVKIRVMPSGFFILLRYYLRVDHVMAKVCDTRIHFEKGNQYFLRQYQVREDSFKNLNNVDPHTFSDINILYTHLPVRKEVTDKIFIS